MKNFGAHVTKGKQISSALDQAQLWQMSAVQIFLTPPQRMISPSFADGELEAWNSHPYRSQVKVYVHAPYVLNFVDSGRVGALSVHCIKSQMDAAADIGAEGLVVHCGSWKGEKFDFGMASGRRNLEKVLNGSRGTLLIENMSSGAERTSLGIISDLLAPFPSYRTGICFDTAHAYGAGIPIDQEDGVLGIYSTYNSLIKLIHINDVSPKVVFGKGLDRHDNFGRLAPAMRQIFQLFSADFVIERGETFGSDMQSLRLWAGLPVMNISAMA